MHEALPIYDYFLFLCHIIFFFFNDTATTEIYTLSLHDALPILPIEAVASNNGIELRPLQTTAQKFDYIENISGALDFAKSRGEKGYEFLESTLSVLEMLNNARNGPVDIVA